MNSGSDKPQSPGMRARPPGRFGGIQSDYLYELARRRDPEARIELGNAVTDLFVEGDLSLREQDIVSDILITMLRQAERDIRKSISDRLAALDQAPLRVVLFLANDEIDVASPVLKKSPVLEDMDLMLIIETQGSFYWQAIAARPDLRAVVVQALAETRDVGTAKVLLNNEAIVIPAPAHLVMADMARTANDLCIPLLKRADLPKELITAIYEAAGEKVIADMKAMIPAERMAELMPHVHDIVTEHVEAADESYDPTAMMIEAAKSLQQKGRLSIEGMIQSLRNGQIASFIAQMMVFMGTNLSHVKNMMQDEQGKMMAALCRVHRVDKKVFLKLFLLTQKYRTGERVVDPMILNAALTEFDMMSMADARAIADQIRMPA